MHDAETVDDKKMKLEEIKLQADTTKHITTLATGTIVLVATFMDKLPKPLQAPDLLVGSLIAMLVCTFSAFVHLWSLTLLGPRRLRMRRFLPNHKTIESLLVIVMYFSFSIGLYELGGFAFKNIRSMAHTSSFLFLNRVSVVQVLRQPQHLNFIPNHPPVPRLKALCLDQSEWSRRSHEF